MKFRAAPSSRLSGVHRVASDKSISHRALILGALAEGVTEIRDLLEADDVLATMQALRQMGIAIECCHNDGGSPCYRVHGRGLTGLRQPEQVLDLGNSGTAMRLLAGVICAQPWSATMTGDVSLVRRPMARIIEPLTAMGARIDAHNGYPPLVFSPPSALQGIDYRSPVASAQVKSALLLAGLFAAGETRVVEPGPTRDHTERMLRGYGYAVRADDNGVALHGGGALTPCAIRVPADLSSAAFFMLAGLICPDSELLLTGVGNNPSRNGVIALLRRMGGRIELVNEQVIGGEPVADIRVATSQLEGCVMQGADIPRAIDEIPVLAVAAAVARGKTVIRDAAELRVKESDRIHGTVVGLRALGVAVDETEDGMVIHGGRLGGGEVDSFGDHRLAMAFAVAAAAADAEVIINRCDNVATSFPEFSNIAKNAGMILEVSP